MHRSRKPSRHSVCCVPAFVSVPVHGHGHVSCGGGWGRFRGGFPGHRPAPVLLCLASSPPRPPVPIHGPTASRQPRPSVVADVWLCHGNPRTGCASGSRQGQAHAHRPPTPFPSPKAYGKEPLGAGSGTGGVCVRREAEPASSVIQGFRGKGWGGCVCTSQGSAPPPAAGALGLLPSALQSDAKEAGWGGEVPISRV